MKAVSHRDPGCARFSSIAMSILLVASGCGQTVPEQAPTGESLRVTKDGQPFAMWEGAAARKAADAQCGPRGVRTSIYDRFDRATGAWVYPEGCA